MDQNSKSNIIYASKILIPVIIIIGLFLGGVGAGIITFESPNNNVDIGKINFTIIIDFSDGTTYKADLAFENITGFDILSKLEELGIVGIETTYWESFDGYVVDSITYQGKKYESDSNHFWAFYVNGEPSMVGADKVYVNNYDLIEWRYDSF